MDVRKVRRGKGYEAWYKGAWDEDDKGVEKAALAAEASQTAEKKETAACIFRTAM